MSVLKDQISDFISQELLGSEHFLVKVMVSSDLKIVRVMVDGDEGVSIDRCTELSRALGNFLEENDLIPNAYTLEVSSPGVSEPLHFPRQYPKHVGRTLKVSFPNGEKCTGKLIGTHADGYQLEITAKEKGKKATTLIQNFPFDEANEVKVEVSFK
jgi:ribosome maturation factor RimP